MARSRSDHGVVLPTVHVEAASTNDKIHRSSSIVLDDVDLDYRPDPLDFVVAAPAGTLIIDYREDREHPKMGAAHYPVADVIVYADGMSARNRSIEPRAESRPAGAADQPASWLDRNGPTGPPDLAGKVVLVDFWGITCGPCVAELPEVQAAADHFAAKSKDFVLIGLHDSGATVDQVAEFARKRGLTYRLAIDRPAHEEGWFGATFQAYGVRAIPERRGDSTARATSSSSAGSPRHFKRPRTCSGRRDIAVVSEESWRERFTVVLHTLEALSRRTPPVPPLRKGGRGKGPLRLNAPPLRRGDTGG